MQTEWPDKAFLKSFSPEPDVNKLDQAKQNYSHKDKNAKLWSNPRPTKVFFTTVHILPSRSHYDLEICY